MRHLVLTLNAAIVLLAAACVPPTAEPATPQPPTAPAVASPTARPSSPLPTPTATVVIESPPSQVEPTIPGPAAIVEAAVEFAAVELGVDPASIQVVSVDAVEWNNSCLGVEKPNQMCLEVITPGYRVLLNVEGKEVAVHTNQAGSVMLLADPAQGAPSVQPVSMPWDPAEIYAIVVRRLYTVDHTFGQAPLFPVIYLLRRTDDSAGAPGSPSNSQTIFPGDQQRITSLLADLPAEFIWVESAADVPQDAMGTVADRGAVVTLGNISQQADGSLYVPSSIYMGMLAAGGQTYVLEAVDGIWQVTGVAGPAWMS